ncbi:hypothetical protein [Saccharothrix syringae]|uniref:Uncharacterized protein n=1 Tax=Saccharothrix syringae TaxID=103733 RepID=A0A5Q0H674_SACSY|nr:hypothetical protein [Saccharothrix syringae]QFZ21415.1 hypothetical protein EKG83_32125 [Saccharothrix syringae]
MGDTVATAVGGGRAWPRTKWRGDWPAGRGGRASGAARAGGVRPDGALRASGAGPEDRLTAQQARIDHHIRNTFAHPVIRSRVEPVRPVTPAGDFTDAARAPRLRYSAP